MSSLLSQQAKNWGKPSTEQKSGANTQSNLSVDRCPSCSSPFKNAVINAGVDLITPLNASFCPNCRLTFPK